MSLKRVSRFKFPIMQVLIACNIYFLVLILNIFSVMNWKVIKMIFGGVCKLINVSMIESIKELMLIE